MADLLERARPLFYNEVLSVPDSILVPIISKEMTARTSITNIVCSGEIYAEYSLFHKGKKVAVKRSSPTRNVDFSFPSDLTFEEKDLFEVKVIHYRTDQTPKFECGVFGYN